MNKQAERINVLTESENKNFVHAVINAVTKGYADNTVLEDIMDLVRRKEVSKGVLTAAPEALRSYGDSLKASLDFLADQVEQFEIIDEPTFRKKEVEKDIKTEEDVKNQQNVVEKEIDKLGVEKNASFNRFASVEVSEDWSKYSYDKKSNVMSGHLIIAFKQDMNDLNIEGKVSLSKKDLDFVVNKVYSYLESAFKLLKKSSLNTEIFKSKIKFSSLEKGTAEVDYQIKGAF